MTTDDLYVRPHIERTPVHPTITHEQITCLVDSFYDRIRDNDIIGPIFNDRIQNNWPSHLSKMKSFWRSVLMKTGEYKGRPLPPHAEMKDKVAPEDYKIWLDLFRQTANETFTPEAAPIVIATAERIAQSFWLGIYGASPFDKAPEWMNTTTL